MKYALVLLMLICSHVGYALSDGENRIFNLSGSGPRTFTSPPNATTLFLIPVETGQVEILWSQRLPECSSERPPSIVPNLEISAKDIPPLTVLAWEPSVIAAGRRRNRTPIINVTQPNMFSEVFLKDVPGVIIANGGTSSPTKQNRSAPLSIQQIALKGSDVPLGLHGTINFNDTSYPFGGIEGDEDAFGNTLMNGLEFMYPPLIITGVRAVEFTLG